MNASHAVILLDQHSASDDLSPLMLRDLLFCPALHWLIQALQQAGVERFFLCHDLTDPAALDGLLPEGAVLARRDDPDLDAQLRAFAAGSRGPLLAVTRPVWLSFAGAQMLAEDETLPVGGADTGIFRLSPGAVSGLADLSGGEGFAPTQEEPLLALPLSGAEDLPAAQYLARYDVIERAMAAGVSIVDPDTTYLDPACVIAPGARLLPGTILRGRCVIGPGCEIGPNSMLTRTEVGARTSVNASQLTDATVGEDTTVGPFAYVRPNSHIGSHVKVGDFVEVKNSVIGDGTKISHLTYVGDSDVGQRVNFGCGTVTVNYDGNRKYRTTIGDDCFIGCNTNLVAPVRVEDGAYTAAGSTITDDVPGDALAIARARQSSKPGWAARHRAKK